MSKPDQSVPKVMAVVIHRPLDLTGVSLPLRHLLQCVLYPIGCSSGIVLSGLQGGAAVAGSGSGRSLGSIPRNRPLEKSYEDGM